VAEKPVQTKWGPMTREDAKSLRAVTNGEDNDAVVQWNGQELHVGFGRHLADYIETTLAKRNTRGL
jgi:uncharacterized membrane protein